MTETGSSNHTHHYDSSGELTFCSDSQIITDEFGNDTGHRVCWWESCESWGVDS